MVIYLKNMCYCEANNTTDITLYRVRSYILLYIIAYLSYWRGFVDPNGIYKYFV
jgi:hypothetical protein